MLHNSKFRKMKTQKMKVQLSIMLILLLGFTATIAQDSWNSKSERKSRETIEKFQDKSWTMESILEDSYGYAVFPSIGKGGFGIGGAFGKGILYESGAPVGGAKMTQISIGFQWGGQAYSEIIVFENKDAIESFKSNRLELAAQASAIAVTAGVSADVPYKNGVAIYTLPKAGLMYEASVGGQKFKYIPEMESESDDL
jgi:lipid-binding SYLF domain-containing protein